MNSDSANPGGHSQDHVNEELLRAVESAAPGQLSGGVADSGIDFMRRDRSALRGALARELSRPISPELHARFSQSVRDEMDRAALAELSRGTPLSDRLPVSAAPLPRRDHAAGSYRLRWSARPAWALAATVAVVAGVSWLALQRPEPTRDVASSGASIGAPSGGPRELPAWAILPDRPAPGADPVPIAPPQLLAQKPEAQQEPLVTSDPATALAWARRGVLAVRIVTQAPNSDHERLSGLVDRDARSAQWALSSAAPAGQGALPSKPWPINTTVADERASGFSNASHPETATIALYTMLIRPSAEALDAARAALAKSLSGAVVFERVEGLAPFAPGPLSEPLPETAMDVIWWKKPVREWTPRVQIPVVLEFGSPGDTAR